LSALPSLWARCSSKSESGPPSLRYGAALPSLWARCSSKSESGLRLRRTMLGLVLFWGFFAGACSRAPEETGQIPTLAAAPAAKAGEMIFQTRCFVCHGRGGKGDGPSSSGLGATVRDLTNWTWQDSTSDETIRNVIRNGATAIGGTAAMAPNPDLSNAQIQSLMLYIRSLRKE
jgi:mono/diheme cytochrome c family protein